MIVGDPSRFAIESNITEFCGSPSQVGLGFFVVHVQGKSYGIRDPRATMLGLPLDTVSQFTARRGTHRLPMSAEPDARLLCESILAAAFDPDRQRELFFGMSAERLFDLTSSLDWHAGGDEAFDDGSHIFHFDVGDRVRVLACRNDTDYQPSWLSDLWMEADEFYGLLQRWKQEFEVQIAARKIG
jgi:hypothetical protein